MRLTGIILIAMVLIAPLHWFIALAAQHPPVSIFSQYLGALALIAMGISQFLVTRIWGIESVFGGLDRIFVLHKWLAVFAMICLGLHDIIDAEIDSLGRETLIADIAEDVGEIALYGFLILVFVTVTTFIPYHLWRWSHRFIGLFYILATFHFMFVQKPFSYSDPLGIYILTFCYIGIASYLYMLIIYGRFPRPAPYEVQQVTSFSEGAEITLAATGRGIVRKAGQFAFVDFDLPGLKEVHPFTISGAPQTGHSISFSIKAVGGYTSELVRNVKPGTRARVFGAFGRFIRPVADSRQIWVGAGIGITPFMAWTRSLSKENIAQIHLYYCVRDISLAPFLEELTAISARIPGFTLTVVDSQGGNRLSAARLVKDAGSSLAETSVYYCGPVTMRNSLRTELRQRGLPTSRFHFEHFEIRTDIGLTAVIAKIAGFVMKFTRN